MRPTIIFLAGLMSIMSYAQEPGKVTLRNTDQFVLESKSYLGEPFTIQICLPKNYDISRSYPLIILLDADKSIGMAKDIADWLMFRQEISDVIICGIAYNNDDETWWINRSRDFCPTLDTISQFGKYWPKAGGADIFLDFIQNDLLKEIGKRYKISSDESGIIGFSFGGLLVSYALFTRPNLFKNYLIISPALVWDDFLIHRLEVEFADKCATLNKNVFISLSADDSGNLVNIPTQRLVETLRSRNFTGLNLYYEFFEGETHFSGYPRAMTTGLKRLYKIKSQ